ncbi:MAG: nicotinamide riboside transporter PnuC [Bacteroidota bacterium]
MVELEYLGAFTGILGIWLTIRQSIWCFAVGLVSVIISSYVFYQSYLFADAIQQLVFAAIILYGWRSWSSPLPSKKAPVSKSKWSELVPLFIVTSFVGVILGYLLDRYTEAHYPWLDSILTSFCFLAQYMIAKRKIENWGLWMITNAAYIMVYLKKDLEPYAVLYAFYLLLAIYGWREWSREIQKNA